MGRPLELFSELIEITYFPFSIFLDYKMALEVLSNICMAIVIKLTVPVI